MTSQVGPEHFDGSWERSGRSVNAAALTGLLGIGIIYFYGQSVVLAMVMFVTVGFDSQGSAAEGYFQHLSHVVDLTKTPLRIVLMLSQFSLMLLPVVWLVRRWHTGNVRAYIRLRSSSVAQIVLAACAAALLFPLNIALSEFFSRSLNIPDELVKINEGLFTASSVGEFVFVILAIAVTPAICEEILFRGYAQRTFERTLGWKSILLVGVLFGLFHMQPLGLLFLSGLGFVFGFFFFTSKSLLPGMAAHFTNNAIVVSWYSLLKSGGLVRLRTAMEYLPVIVVLTMPLAALAVYGFWSVSRKREIGETTLLPGSPVDRRR